MPHLRFRKPGWVINQTLGPSTLGPLLGLLGSMQNSSSAGSRHSSPINPSSPAPLFTYQQSSVTCSAIYSKGDLETLHRGSFIALQFMRRFIKWALLRGESWREQTHTFFVEPSFETLQSLEKAFITGIRRDFYLFMYQELLQDHS